MEDYSGKRRKARFGNVLLSETMKSTLRELFIVMNNRMHAPRTFYK